MDWVKSTGRGGRVVAGHGSGLRSSELCPGLAPEIQTQNFGEGRGGGDKASMESRGLDLSDMRTREQRAVLE